jgi:TonB family protein
VNVRAEDATEGGRGLSAKPYMVSLLCHAGAIAVVIVVATLNVRQDPEVIEVEIVEIPPPLEEPVVPPSRPAPPVPVPDVEIIRKVETDARPFHAEAQNLNQRQRDPNNVVNREAPTLTFAIPMEATVDGGEGFEVVAVVGADPGMHGDPSIVSLPAVEYADSWEITVEPEPLNDREFKPVYPLAAKARGQEAAVEVEVLVDSSGAVAETRVLISGGDAFSTSALEYCRKLRFKPALANHVPVASRIVWVVDYRFGNR